MSAVSTSAFAPFERFYSLPASRFPLLGKAQAEQDLNQLAALIAERSSYAWSVSYPYVAVIDAIKAQLPDKVQVEYLAMTVQKLIQEIGDAHALVVDLESFLPGGFSPVGLGTEGRRQFAYWLESSELLDPRRPYVHRLDGVPVTSWLYKAAAISCGTYGSDSSKLLRGFRYMRYTQSLRLELGLPLKDSLCIELVDETGRDARVVEVPLRDAVPPVPPPLRLPRESRLLPDNVGYLRIYSQHAAELPSAIHEQMRAFRDTDALIIDARQCGGGVRDNLMALFPYFMPAKSQPYIANVCKLRIPEGEREGFDPIGKLDTWDKKVPYRHDPAVPAEHRSALERFLASFQPVWNPPADSYTDWYFMAMDPDGQHYHYAAPVYLMIDWGVGSAGDIFASTFKDWPNVRLLGMPTNGRSGNAIEFRLKHSDIGFMLSTMASFQKDGQLYEGTGVQPDHFLAPTMNDWLGNTDTQLERTLALVRKHLSAAHPQG